MDFAWALHVGKGRRKKVRNDVANDDATVALWAAMALLLLSVGLRLAGAAGSRAPFVLFAYAFPLWQVLRWQKGRQAGCQRAGVSSFRLQSISQPSGRLLGKPASSWLSSRLSLPTMRRLISTGAMHGPKRVVP